VTDDQIAAFVAEHALGTVVAAIDAPLVVPNDAGRRDCTWTAVPANGRVEPGAAPTALAPPRRGEPLSLRGGSLTMGLARGSSGGK
jgi:predicted RNase H-like nuclease